MRDVRGAAGPSLCEGLLRPRCADIVILSWQPLSFRHVTGYPAPATLGFLGRGQEASRSRREGVEAS